MLDPLVEFEVERTVNVVVGQFRVEGAALSERHVQVRMLVVGQHDRDRTLDVRQPGVQQRPAGAGGVDDVAVAQQHERVDALLLHGGSQPGAAFAVHPGAIRQVRNVEQRRTPAANRRNAVMRLPGTS